MVLAVLYPLTLVPHPSYEALGPRPGAHPHGALSFKLAESTRLHHRGLPGLAMPPSRRLSGDFLLFLLEVSGGLGVVGSLQCRMEEGQQVEFGKDQEIRLGLARPKLRLVPPWP